MVCVHVTFALAVLCLANVPLVGQTPADDYTLRNLKTIFADASRANHFGNDQLKVALESASGFAALKPNMVNVSKSADVMLDASYTLLKPFRVEPKQ